MGPPQGKGLHGWALYVLYPRTASSAFGSQIFFFFSSLLLSSLEPSDAKGYEPSNTIPPWNCCILSSRLRVPIQGMGLGCSGQAVLPQSHNRKPQLYLTLT